MKFTALDDHLLGSLDWYVQNRTQLSQGARGITSVIGTVGRGRRNGVALCRQPQYQLHPGGQPAAHHHQGARPQFAYVPARTYGVSPQNGFGGSYIVYDFSTLPGRSGNYEDTLLPHAVISPYVTWTSDAETWGPLTNLKWGATFGGTYVGHTQQTVPDPIVYPAYVTLNASAFAQWDVWEADLNVNNLGDERYFTPGADTYANLSALPGIGRIFKVTLKRLF